MRQHYAEAAEPLRKDRPHEKACESSPEKWILIMRLAPSPRLAIPQIG